MKSNLAKLLALIYLTLALISSCYAQSGIEKDSSISQKFYAKNNEQIFWFSSLDRILKMSEWLIAIDSSEDFNENTRHLNTNQIRVDLFSEQMSDTSFKKNLDERITCLVLNYLDVLQAGNIRFDYDEVSPNRENIYINQLLYSKNKESVPAMINRLSCKDPEYIFLKKYLIDSLSKNDTLKYKSVLIAMNYRKYFALNHQTEYVIVNLPETQAYYYQNNTLQMKMKTVIGKPTKPTPTMATNMTGIVTFPYWNVPRSIVVKELLPKMQTNDEFLELSNIEVLNLKGEAVDDSELNWNDYSDKNFPFLLRQSTGIDNAMGVIKFEINNPFAIYLHASSRQGVFASNNRFLSHGCIRLEKPIELANAILHGTLNIPELKKGRKNTKSKIIKLTHKIPVYIIYNPLIIEGSKIILLDDIYNVCKI
ncbi:MAG: L,D-transpeptidase family protein [Bacteroidota bacterium]